MPKVPIYPQTTENNGYLVFFNYQSGWMKIAFTVLVTLEYLSKNTVMKAEVLISMHSRSKL